MKEKECKNDSFMHFYNENDSLKIYFYGNYEKKSLEKLKIEHVRNGNKIKDINFKKSSGHDISISKEISLTSIDTLSVIFSDNDKIILHQFKNEPKYGGKKFLGCYFGTYMINEEKKGILDGSTLRVY